MEVLKDARPTSCSGDPDTWRLPVLTQPHLSFNIAKTPDMGGYYIFAPLAWFSEIEG